THCTNDVGNGFQGLMMEVLHTSSLRRHMQSVVKRFVLSCNARRTFIVVTAKRLNTSQCQHHRASCVGCIRSKAKKLYDIESCGDLTSSKNFYFVANTRLAQAIHNDHQG